MNGLPAFFFTPFTALTAIAPYAVHEKPFGVPFRDKARAESPTRKNAQKNGGRSRRSLPAGHIETAQSDMPVKTIDRSPTLVVISTR
jgi:hypothetical protein